MLNKHQIIAEGKRIITVERLALERTAEALDERFAEAVSVLAQANKVLVSGVGKSGIIARKIAATLSSVGTPAVVLHPVEALHGDMGIVQEGDAAILLSKSGTTAELITLLPFLRRKAITIIGIVGNKDSWLARQVDICVDAHIEQEACSLNLAPSASTTVALALGDALALSLMQYKGFGVTDFASTHPLGQLGKNLTLSVNEVMHKNDYLPVVQWGRNFREALIEMTAKALGCVCVVDDTGRLCGIITDGDVRRTLQQNEDIRHLLVEQVMTASPVAISPESLLGEALALMEEREKQISVLPVVASDNRCVGVIRVHDIIRSGL